VRGIANSASEFEDARFNAPPNYMYLRANGSFGARLPADFTLVWRLAGQYALDPLVSYEQYSIAGADGVRGYLEAEVLADTGIKTTLQLGTPQLKWSPATFTADGFVFYDFGRSGAIDPLPGEPSNTSLASFGAGINLAAFRHATGVVTWAYPLKNGIQTRSGDSFVLFTTRVIW
jgi:hemolysin activation/secretion protein